MSQAKQQLSLAHKELVNSKFFDSVHWDGWTIYYNAGERAVEEIRVLT